MKPLDWPKSKKNILLVAIEVINLHLNLPNLQFYAQNLRLNWIQDSSFHYKDCHLLRQRKGRRKVFASTVMTNSSLDINVSLPNSSYQKIYTIFKDQILVCSCQNQMTLMLLCYNLILMNLNLRQQKLKLHFVLFWVVPYLEL